MQEGRSRQPEDIKLSNRGYVHLQSKEYDQAGEYFKRSLKINPENPYAILNMGVVYETRGERDEAIRMYERLISLDSDERAFNSTDPIQRGRKLTDIARDNLDNLLGSPHIREER